MDKFYYIVGVLKKILTFPNLYFDGQFFLNNRVR